MREARRVKRTDVVADLRTPLSHLYRTLCHQLSADSKAALGQIKHDVSEWDVQKEVLFSCSLLA